jgi:SAM-dependent methyltransferase
MNNNINEQNIMLSHKSKNFVTNHDEIKAVVDKTIERLQHSKNLHLPLKDEIELTHELAKFELGKFLLINKGLNGYWTSYLINKNQENINNEISPLENWLTNKSLFYLIKDRFTIYQKEIQKRIKSGYHISSIPCGLMDDLLFLNYDNFSDIKLTGIDIDKESLNFAKEKYINYNFKISYNFLQKNALNLNLFNEFELITSNGLNHYISDEYLLIQLYKNFYNSLKTNGYLLISFIPPPIYNNIYEKFEISPKDWLIDRAIFDDIIQAKYLNFVTEEKIKLQLSSIGFKIEDIIYNKNGVNPVLVAIKK